MGRLQRLSAEAGAITSRDPKSPEAILDTAKSEGLHVPSKYDVDRLGRLTFKLGSVKYTYTWGHSAKKLFVSLTVDGKTYTGTSVAALKDLADALKKVGVK